MTVSISVLEYGARALKSLAVLDTEFDSTRAQREMRRAGCPAILGESILGALVDARLVKVTLLSDDLMVTDAGRTAAEALNNRDWSIYATRLLELPWLQAQLHASLGAVSVDADGSLVDRERVALHWPMLAVVLGWLPSVPGRGGNVRLPTHWLDRLHFAPEPAEVPAWVQANAAVGNRAERYSLHFERSRTAPAAVLWVASESDRYGYDIEVQEHSGIRAVEVKGSSTARRQFQLTGHELDVAGRLGGRYVVQFWGEIDTQSDMAEEYQRLRVRGYPIQYRNPAALIEAGELAVQASVWQVVDSM